MIESRHISLEIGELIDGTAGFQEKEILSNII
jgi:hypothetical protein